MRPHASPVRRLATTVLLACLLTLAGCSSMGTFFAFLGGRVVITEEQLQQRLDRRYPRDFEAGEGIATLTVQAPQARLHDETLSLAFDLEASVAGLRLPLRGHLAIDSGLRFDPQSQALYLHEPHLTRLDLPRVPGAPDQDELFALGDRLLAEYARNEPIYVLDERRQAQVPWGRSVYRVDIEDGRLVIGVRR